jgi:hypothetical protein
VHGAALAAAEPVLPPKDLLHHPVHVAAFGDAMAVAAMRRGDSVAVVQMHTDADARGLLAGIEMHESWNIAGRELYMHRILKLADGAHSPVSAK